MGVLLPAPLVKFSLDHSNDSALLITAPTIKTMVPYFIVIKSTLFPGNQSTS